VLETYEVELGFRSSGHKFQEGDGRTPEGEYIIDRRNPNSEFYLSHRHRLSQRGRHRRRARRLASIRAGTSSFMARLGPLRGSMTGRQVASP
jgi:hypothetical protein